MKRKTLTLNNKTFTFYKNMENITPRYDNIYKAYEKPSATKINIWNEWCEWCEETFKHYDISVASRNCNVFTIYICAAHEDYGLLELYITPTYDYYHY